MNDNVSWIISLLIFAFPYVGRFWFSRNTLASTVVSLGLLGTFSGILLGLMDFDIHNIEAALPTLIEGLKTAFLTSIAGMIASLFLKLCPIIYGIKAEKETTQEESEIDKMIHILSEIRDNTANGDPLNSISEIQKSMQVNNENFTTLLSALQDISLKVAQVNTQSQESMGSFENKVFERLDNTLQELNSTLQALCKWQETNGEQTKEINDKLLETLGQIKLSTEHFGEYMNTSVGGTQAAVSRQNSKIENQLNDLNSFVQSTGTQLQQQMTQMEEKFERELTAMEQFSKTLISIIRKLSQDHSVLAKRQQDTDENN